MSNDEKLAVNNALSSQHCIDNDAPSCIRQGLRNCLSVSGHQDQERRLDGRVRSRCEAIRAQLWLDCACHQAHSAGANGQRHKIPREGPGKIMGQFCGTQNWIYISFSTNDDNTNHTSNNGRRGKAMLYTGAIED